MVQDDQADALFLLAEGVARVSYADPASGQQTRIADLYPGVVFGELSVVGRDRRSATVRARTRVRCHVLERPRLDALREDAPRVYTQVLEHLLLSSSDRLRRANRGAASLRA